MFSPKDKEQITAKGIQLAQIEQQINDFRNGFPFMKLQRPATVNDGVVSLSEAEIEEKINRYEKFEGSKLKFVPASGAASRMFKNLFSFIDEARKEASVINKDEFLSSRQVVESIDSFAFYDVLLNDHKMNAADAVETAELIVSEKGLNYGKLPKGLILFHSYSDGSRTALEEHLVEGAKYAKEADNEVQIHFTVSPEHMNGFKEKVSEVLAKYESQFEVKYKITYSVQKSSTDTLAVDANNEPFRESDGSILFRPGGHGALLENLNALDADLVFIKNIDNVVPDSLKEDTVKYKKALAGLLLETRDRIVTHYNTLLNNPGDDDIASIQEFIQRVLCFEIGDTIVNGNTQEKIGYFKNVLNSPIRVCGMVKNEGEPGGGPFWAHNSDGSVSLQIVEQAQVDTSKKEQNSILKNSTHFNPVDLVCFLKDVEVNKFNLLDYRDPKTGFISKKSKDGKELKALELPGLWNGAMAHWITLFVEVPISTFNPVKTINDLLRKTHQ
jgi:hypothetical protein